MFVRGYLIPIHTSCLFSVGAYGMPPWGNSDPRMMTQWGMNVMGPGNSAFIYEYSDLIRAE